MPQWRKLHVKAVESFDINDMPDDFTRLLWVMLPLKLDSAGRGIDNPSWVKSQVMPLRADVTLEMVAGAMDWYAERGMIERYKVDGRSYFWVPTFAQYQGNTSREAPSHLPAPNSEDNQDEVMTNSRPTHDQDAQESSTDSDVDSDSNTDTPTEGESAADDQPLSLKKTPSRRILKAKLDAGVFHPQNRRGPLKFPTQQTADKFDQTAERLNSNLSNAIDAALEQGCTSVVRVVNYIAKWQPNGGKPNGPRRRIQGGNEPNQYSALTAEQRQKLGV